MSGITTLEVLERFKKAYIQFIDELLEQFPEETDLIIIRVFFENQVPVSLVAEQYLKHVLPLEDMITKRNEKFFIENNSLFNMLDGGKVLHFKKLWLSNKLDKDDKDAIWKWFETFNKLMKTYKKLIN